MASSTAVNAALSSDLKIYVCLCTRLDLRFLHCNYNARRGRPAQAYGTQQSKPHLTEEPRLDQSSRLHFDLNVSWLLRAISPVRLRSILRTRDTVRIGKAAKFSALRRTSWRDSLSRYLCELSGSVEGNSCGTLGESQRDRRRCSARSSCEDPEYRGPTTLTRKSCLRVLSKRYHSAPVAMCRGHYETWHQCGCGPIFIPEIRCETAQQGNLAFCNQIGGTTFYFDICPNCLVGLKGIAAERYENTKNNRLSKVPKADK